VPPAADARQGTRRTARYGLIPVLSSWVVFFLVWAVADFLFDHAKLTSTSRWLWYALISVAALRAAYRTFRYVQERRATTRPGSDRG
jgi:hypothetical protein